MDSTPEHKHDFGASGECRCGMHRGGAPAIGNIPEDAERGAGRRVCDELTQLAQEMGLYDEPAPAK